MEENTRIKNMMGFFTETLESGHIRYYYQDPFTGQVEELSEYEYYDKFERVIRGADMVERIVNN